MTAFTTHVQGAGAWLEADHPDPGHQMKLARLLRNLPAGHALGWCGGCEWYARWPVRLIDHLNGVALQRLGMHHVDDLVAGRACLDPDLADGGEAYLRERLGMIPRKEPAK